MEQEIEQGVYYLKKCIIVLQSAESLPALLPLCERLVQEGIDCRVLLSEELQDEESMAERSEKSSLGTLYLTDAPEVYATLAADFLSISLGDEYKSPGKDLPGERTDNGSVLNSQPPVLIYLHSGNQDADFGDARYALEDPQEVEPEYLERVYRRCHNLPWEILVTERCWLRETVEKDVDSFWRMYQEPEITQYTEQLYPSPEAERGYVREYRRLVYAFYEFGVWTVLDRQSGAVVGRAGLSVREGYDLPELGFVIGRKWQGRGLAREVCQGILKYAGEQLGFDRIQVLVHEENAVSLHLCRKLGFREQERFRKRAVLTQTGQENMPDEPDISPHSLVEMEQDGQPARFVYMVREQDTSDKS